MSRVWVHGIGDPSTLYPFAVYKVDPTMRTTLATPAKRPACHYEPTNQVGVQNHPES